MHCLEATVGLSSQVGMVFTGPAEVELGLRVVEEDGAAQVQVELCQVRGRARLAEGCVAAVVGERFELFFRLHGAAEARVRVELHPAHSGIQMEPGGPEARFALRALRPAEAAPTPAGLVQRWLEQLSDPGERQVLAHVAAHGAVTEVEAAAMLGGARGLRRFALRFDELARQAPFGLRIDVVAGIKRFVKEGQG
jgi:hypothetical protein